MNKIKSLEIPEVVHFRPQVHSDERGLFFEFNKRSNDKLWSLPKFFQENVSISRKNVLRGLHFQEKPFEQSKLVLVLKGKIFDVVVDIRPNSPTFGKHCSITLDSEKKDILYIPEGFAHGFLSRSDETIVCYKVSKEYSQTHDSGIIWNDKHLNIEWPCESPILSDKDKTHSTFCPETQM